jgi:tyrosinase
MTENVLDPRTSTTDHEAASVGAPHPSPTEGHHGGHDHTRFPTADEVRRFVGDEVEEQVAIDFALLSYERHLTRFPDTQAHASDRFLPHRIADFATTLVSPTQRQVLPPWLVAAILASLRRRRSDHRTMDAAARAVFNQALQQAHQAGAYQALAAIHASAATHRIHSMQGAIGTQRFLPWHRIYLVQFENLLRGYQPLVRIPYWNFANDAARPDWVWLPPGVARRTPGAFGGALPTQAGVDAIGAEPTYTGFTFALEHLAHNDVHNWCNGTISAPPTAPQDPIFWLLHANVDRIWNLWQATHSGKPVLKAMDWILDPFAVPASDADSVVDLGYSYR